MATKPKGQSRRGFAAMNREEQRAIASKGGRAAHERGTAHEWTSAEAAEAGRKGGRAPRYSARTTEDEAKATNARGRALKADVSRVREVDAEEESRRIMRQRDQGQEEEDRREEGRGEDDEATIEDEEVPRRRGRHDDDERHNDRAS